MKNAFIYEATTFSLFNLILSVSLRQIPLIVLYLFKYYVVIFYSHSTKSISVKKEKKIFIYLLLVDNIVILFYKKCTYWVNTKKYIKLLCWIFVKLFRSATFKRFCYKALMI